MGESKISEENLMKEDQPIEQNLKKAFELFLVDESKKILKIYQFQNEDKPNLKNKIKRFFEKDSVIIKRKFIAENDIEYLWIEKKKFSIEYEDLSQEAKEQIIDIKDFSLKNNHEENVNLYLCFIKYFRRKTF